MYNSSVTTNVWLQYGDSGLGNAGGGLFSVSSMFKLTNIGVTVATYTRDAIELLEESVSLRPWRHYGGIWAGDAAGINLIDCMYYGNWLGTSYLDIATK